MQFQVPIRVADHGLGPTSEIKRLPRHLRAGLGEPASEEHFIQKYNFKFCYIAWLAAAYAWLTA
jgi:hypothetical protein